MGNEVLFWGISDDYYYHYLADGTINPPAGYPNPYVELCINTHLPASGTQGTQCHSRNHINILTSDIVIALPGSAGTASEVFLARRSVSG